MLISLHIENIAVIKCSDMEFSSGFTVFTGETGAGKSIIIDSINFLLGNRTDRDLIRSGEDKAEVSALFSDINEACVSYLSQYDISPDENGEILIVRTMSSDGKGSVRINGKLSSVSVLKAASSCLINIHGQHDSKTLLDEKQHISVLDSYADNGELLKEYSVLYERICEIKNEVRSLKKSEEEKARMMELLGYQIKDIDSAKLKPGEEEMLLSRESTLKNIEKISKQVRFVNKALYSNEKGVTASTLARKAAEALSEISDVFSDADEYVEKLESFAAEMEEIAISAKEAIGDNGIDPQIELDEVQSRLDRIQKLKRKYGNSIEEIIKFREKIGKEFDEIENGENRIAELMREYKQIKEKADAVSEKIYVSRKEKAAVLEKQICDVLSFLEMPKVRFKADIRHFEEKYFPDGKDEVEFLLSANLGEELKPLSKIASGGELSRIMLAMKSVLREKEKTSTLIFDEIDTGISGKTSQKVGIKLKETSKNCQVICITHSAQIASLADDHLLIRKQEINGRVESGVKRLGRDERVKELARIMGGQSMTDTLYRSAEELIEESRKY